VRRKMIKRADYVRTSGQ